MLLDGNIPTDTPLVFGEGIISTDSYEFAITFSPEMNELYFTRRKRGEDNEIYTMKLVDGQWSNPEPTFFPQLKDGILNLISVQMVINYILEAQDP